jgi:tungstate transport system permease protein
MLGEHDRHHGEGPGTAGERSMSDFAEAFQTAGRLIFERDPALIGIVLLSLRVSLSAVALATILGLPMGALLALARFPGRAGAITVLNACMGFPPVIAGLVLYLLLSRTGPLGGWGLLFTPAAMVIAQCGLVTPIIAAITRQLVEDLWAEHREQLKSLGAGRIRAAATLLWDARLSLGTAVLAGFGRASAEVGAIIIVGGNISGVTRTMTTAIALETSKGDFAQGIALGAVLMVFAIGVTVLLAVVQGERSMR